MTEMTLDPRTKFLASLACILATLLSKTGTAFIALSGLTAVVVVISGTPLRRVVRNVLLLSWLVLITFFLHFWTALAEQAAPWQPASPNSTLDGIVVASLAVGRLILVVGWVSILNASCSPLQLISGIERLLRPLQRLKLPVAQLSIVTMLSVRFIPILFEEGQHLVRAHIARGLDLHQGTLAARVKRAVHLCLPLFTNMLHRVEHVTAAMESRAFRPGAARTSLHQMQMKLQDYVVLAGSLGLLYSVA